MTWDRRPLPPVLRDAIDRLVVASGLDGAAGREFRDDLEDHAREGLAAGHADAEVARRLGDPETAGPTLRGFAPPAPRRPDPSRSESLLRALATDLFFALRGAARSPVLTLAGVTVLGLGIAATAVAFTVVNEILLRPLPVADQDRLVDVWADEPGGNSFNGFGWQDVVTYRDDAVGDDRALASLAAFAGTRLSLGDGGAGRPVVGQLVTEDYFPMLGVTPGLGTLDLPEDPGFGGPRLAVLSHGLWTDAFGNDPGIVGTSIEAGGESWTVVGVAAEGFRGHFIGFPVDLWIPITAADLVLAGFDPADRERMPFEMIGRLTPGTPAETAQASLGRIALRLAEQLPDTHRGHGVGVTPTSGLDHSLRPIVVTFVAVLTLLAGLVLFIACLNVGSLLLVRTLSREVEIAVRLAIGAGTGRLVRQSLVEAGVLAAAGGGFGLLLSRFLSAQVDGLFRRLAPGLGLDLPFDLRVLALTTLAAFAAALLAGAAPGLHLWRGSPAGALRGRSGGGRGARGRAVLVVAQVAASVALVITTGLFVRALDEGRRLDPGIAAAEVGSFVFAPSDPDPGLVEQVLREIRAIPGVRAASIADAVPIGVARSPMVVALPGIEPPVDQDGFIVDARSVGSDYLAATGTTLLRGRDFESGSNGPPEAVVSRAFVERFWPGLDPIGRSLDVGGVSLTVVGVAGDTRYVVQDQTPDPLVYVSMAGAVPVPVTVTFRSADPLALGPEVREVLGRHLPGDRDPVITTASRTLDAGLLPQRLGAALVGLLGAVALLLAAIGLYGLVQYSVANTRHDLAIRLALGGRRHTVLATVLRRGLMLVAAGAGLGVVVAALGAPLLSGFLLGISPRDPLTYGSVVVLFVAVALLASIVPASRAIRIPPASVLRGD